MGLTIVNCSDENCKRQLNADACHYFNGEPYCGDHYYPRRERKIISNHY